MDFSVKPEVDLNKVTNLEVYSRIFILSENQMYIQSGYYPITRLQQFGVDRIGFCTTKGRLHKPMVHVTDIMLRPYRLLLMRSAHMEARSSGSSRS